MDTQRKCGITASDIDAMTGEELLELAKAQGQYVGQRLPTQEEEGVYSPVLDAPRFLRRFYQAHPKKFSQMLEKLRYPDAAHWGAVALSQGLELQNLTVLERQFPAALARWEEKTMQGSKGPWTMTVEYSSSLDSALLLEVSDVARRLWADQCQQYYFQKTKCDQLAQVMEMREQWLQSSHAETARLFYELGWTPLDVMLTWLVSGFDRYGATIDPDCAAEAAREDPETAVWLLDPDHYRAYFADQFHPSYDAAMAQMWTTFLYCYCGWTDFAPLEKGHRLKKMNTHYKATLDRCRTPDWARLELEKELKKAGLLASETPPDWESPKLAKAQRLALTKALVCHYQWRAGDLLAALAAAGKPEVFTGLLWGIYRGDRLETAFLLDREGLANGADGQPVSLPADAWVGLAAATELDKKQLALWKKRMKAADGKPLIRQLSIPAQPPAFEDIGGRSVKQITIYTVSGKWGLDMGDLSVHRRADLLDPIHGYGARVTFDHINNGPEYNNDIVMVHGVSFYRLGGMPFGDHLPERATVSPEELPARFVSMAGAAFKQLAGLK